MNKVYGGTTRGDVPDLCRTCSHGTVVRGEALNATAKYCRALNGAPRFKVIECPQHHRRGTPYINDMEAIAWILDVDKGKRAVGFIDPDKRRKQDAPFGVPTPGIGYPGDPFK